MAAGSRRPCRVVISTTAESASCRALAREIDIAARRKRPGRMSPGADAKRQSKRSDRRAGKRALREETEEDEM